MSKLYTTEKLDLIAAGDQSFIKMMLETFVKSCQEAIDLMNSAQASSDFETIGKAGHKIKPSVDTVAPQLSAGVRMVEKIPENKDTEHLNEFLTDLGATLNQLRTDLSQS